MLKNLAASCVRKWKHLFGLIEFFVDFRGVNFLCICTFKTKTLRGLTMLFDWSHFECRDCHFVVATMVPTCEGRASPFLLLPHKASLHRFLFTSLPALLLLLPLQPKSSHQHPRKLQSSCVNRSRPQFWIESVYFKRKTSLHLRS